ncbi:MAG: glycine cleavage system protein GcvH [Candidatus Marinimicrobia bacterium]|jgi:glycine cleavage system H protein|nr:glycine cleavage system protein GcvH [Candidatus Neomarinimicrobiota bacterium]MBT6870784.1 glycine cleavage system protein GcvH [Candidatus Neomarinimicrobiota bacterium]|tara:strand:- start:566 stop:943 length:378 start_codon:yes stop_codon:yes gene_type:complete
MNIPENLKYSPEHEWIKVDGDCAYIGITDFAQGELGDIVFVEFPEIGDSFSIGDVFGTVEAVKTVADLFAPISGEVIEINDSLEDSPEVINTDAYNDGWIIKLKVTNRDEFDTLLDATSYKGLLS